MNAMTCCCAPAPIDSIATTAATPKIMPSIVSSERSLWTRRLSSPSCRSCIPEPNCDLGSRRNAVITEPAPGCTGPALPAPVFASASGFRSATSVPTGRFVTTICVSVRCDTFTSRGSNERPWRTNTTGLPSCSKSAWRGRYRASLIGAPVTRTCVVRPGRRVAGLRARHVEADVERPRRIVPRPHLAAAGARHALIVAGSVLPCTA